MVTPPPHVQYMGTSPATCQHTNYSTALDNLLDCESSPKHAKMEPFRHTDAHGVKVTTDFGPSPAQVRHEKRKALAKPHFRRTIIRVITLAVGAAMIGVLSHATAVWYSTRNDILVQPHGFRMPGWPRRMNMVPTYVMLAVAILAMFVQMLAFLTLLGKVRRLRESKLHTWTVFATCTTGIVIWIAAAVYFKLQDREGQKNWTLWSWACSHKNLTNGKMSFEAMCIELDFCFYIALVVAVLELASLTLFGLQLKKMKKDRAHYTKITVESR